MGWWPFSRKPRDSKDNVHIKSARHWLEDMQAICERDYDDAAAAKVNLANMQADWRDAAEQLEVSNDLLEGLELRLQLLLSAQGEEWMALLDDADFWKPGWRLERESSEDG